jgi:arsenite methyltransferase
MPPRFIARQLAHPSGPIGRVIGQLMNWHNARMNSFAAARLAPAFTDRLLEIGFGGGVLMRPLVASGAFVAGIDRSRAMVEQAKRRFRKAVLQDRAVFLEGDVETLPFADASFDKIATVNTIYFWTSLDAGFREIHRVLAPGGRLIVGFLPKERMDRMRMPPDIFTTRAPADVVAALATAGFQHPTIERPSPATPWNVVIARKPCTLREVDACEPTSRSAARLAADHCGSTTA